MHDPLCLRAFTLRIWPRPQTIGSAIAKDKPVPPTDARRSAARGRYDLRSSCQEHLMKLVRYCRLLTGCLCGMYILQVAGCTFDSLLLSVVNLTLSALLSQLLGTPLL